MVVPSCTNALPHCRSLLIAAGLAAIDQLVGAAPALFTNASTLRASLTPTVQGLTPAAHSGKQVAPSVEGSQRSTSAMLTSSLSLFTLPSSQSTQKLPCGQKPQGVLAGVSPNAL